MRQLRIFLTIFIVPIFMFILAGCDGTFSPDGANVGPNAAYSPGTGGFGATQGGVQDMGLVRELVANGKVPPAEAFTVEGMFSEHDLPLAGEAGADILNLRGGIGLAPDLDGEDAGWIQVGMSSNIDPNSFPRPAQSFVACVDVSGSMGWFYGDEDHSYPSPGSLARQLLVAITGRLSADDRVALVTYGRNVSTLLSPVSADSPQVSAAIAELNSEGSTNMEAGLHRAFAIARAEAARGSHEVRVLLFTDIQPNVGATDSGSFQVMARSAAEEGVGLTVFGVGVGMRQEVMNAITTMRGGNAFSLFECEDVDALMEDSWPWLVVPIAHELDLTVDAPGQVAVEATYGFPGEAEEGLNLAVASVFPSRRKGALLACLKPTDGGSLAGAGLQGHLSYQTLDGQIITQDLDWTFPPAEAVAGGSWYDQPSVGRTVALAVLVDGMREAAEIYLEDPEVAVEIMDRVCGRVAADAEETDDEALLPERELAFTLRELMREGAPQGDMYGEY